MKNNENIDEYDYSAVDAEETQLYRIRRYEADRALIVNIGITLLFIATAKYIFYMN